MLRTTQWGQCPWDNLLPAEICSCSELGVQDTGHKTPALLRMGFGWSVWPLKCELHAAGDESVMAVYERVLAFRSILSPHTPGTALPCITTTLEQLLSKPEQFILHSQSSGSSHGQQTGSAHVWAGKMCLGSLQ